MQEERHTCTVTVAFARHMSSTVKVTLRLIKHDTTKHGAVDAEFRLFLTSELGMTGHLHASPALPPAKEPMVPNEQGLGRPYTGLGVFEKKKSLAPLGNRT